MEINRTWQLIKLKLARLYVRFKKTACEFCGKKHKLEVHHARMTRKMIIDQWRAGLISFETSLFLINDAEKDCLTLCDDCHLIIGHFGNYDLLNEKAREICQLYGKKV